ncbi:MAG: adenosylhomocysteinase [Candidatus Doudnabacteria bacterium RIFCSPHIGHO2_01_FULL_46_14]|uniref:Adenosylhomocysteinase n=1 Tax=Candidatus Doudnabacteria bacterium RIFCSPHIGHO2_01_FULL_46_14 TaxID=1817824 RepID=A0A1F5NPB2_9BACT|nr:MAG: adenosylhomocysteinase [Candidatus Doudnabacteria bacterium RIFCSPHIGHO2_01_FULL_46_14]
MKYDVKNVKLADSGKKRIEWAAKEMPVLTKMREDFAKKKPLKNLKIAACLHVTAETANLMLTLKAGGAKLALCASNPLSTQDDVAAALVQHYKIPVFARRGENRKVYYQHLNSVLDFRPNMTMDDGADLVSLLHTEREKQARDIWGSSEETTTGVIRLKSLAKSGKLRFPVIAVNDSKTKFMFDNRYGTGQSTVDGIIRATNILLAGKKFIVAGYGWCGRGLANRARGWGAHVIVTEIDYVKALEARMDGFEVMTMQEAAAIGDIFVTATGDINVIDLHIFERMKNGAIVANTGHFDVEINVKALEKIAKEKIAVRPNLVEYKIPPLHLPLAKGEKERGLKSILLIAEGRLVNLAAAEGHPAAVMDMSFAGQTAAADYIAKNHRKLKKQVYGLPEDIDIGIATLKLESMGIEIDTLTAEQKKYLSSWEMGT